MVPGRGGVGLGAGSFGGTTGCVEVDATAVVEEGAVPSAVVEAAVDEATITESWTRGADVGCEETVATGDPHPAPT